MGKSKEERRKEKKENGIKKNQLDPVSEEMKKLAAKKPDSVPVLSEKQIDKLLNETENLEDNLPPLPPEPPSSPEEPASLEKENFGKNTEHMGVLTGYLKNAVEKVKDINKLAEDAIGRSKEAEKTIAAKAERARIEKQIADQEKQNREAELENIRLGKRKLRLGGLLKEQQDWYREGAERAAKKSLGAWKYVIVMAMFAIAVILIIVIG